jgi:hypothetical protein
MTLILGCLLALLVAYIWWRTGQLSADLRNSNVARDQLARQVQQLGGTPAAGPPGSRGEPGKGIVGPSGPPGPSGSPGPASTIPGPRGASGKPAPTITPQPGPSGVPGATVTGPPGPAGKDGTNGADGKDGRDGVDRQTCPDGYSLQPPADDPDALVCRRDNAPAQPDPKPSPTTGQPALDPTRRQYP